MVRWRSVPGFSLVDDDLSLLDRRLTGVSVSAEGTGRCHHSGQHRSRLQGDVQGHYGGFIYAADVFNKPIQKFAP